MRRPLLRLAIVALGAAAQVACTSPESTRTRDSGPGADVGNRKANVEIHAGAEPYYGTPCVVAGIQCTGPSAVFGPRPAHD